MILSLVIGVILIIISFTLKNNENPLSKFANLFRIFGIVVILIGLLSSVFKQIDAGKVGVKSLYGNVQPDVLESGLHVINPLLELLLVTLYTKPLNRLRLPNHHLTKP